jgi:hypothetical protein
MPEIGRMQSHRAQSVTFEPRGNDSPEFVHVEGPDVEANPVWQWVLARRGPVLYAAAYAAVAGVLLLLLSWLGQEALIGMAAVLALVAVNNLIALFRLLRR